MSTPAAGYFQEHKKSRRWSRNPLLFFSPLFPFPFSPSFSFFFSSPPPPPLFWLRAFGAK